MCVWEREKKGDENSIDHQHWEREREREREREKKRDENVIDQPTLRERER